MVSIKHRVVKTRLLLRIGRVAHVRVEISHPLVPLCSLALSLATGLWLESLHTHTHTCMCAHICALTLTYCACTHVHSLTHTHIYVDMHICGHRIPWANFGIKCSEKKWDDASVADSKNSPSEGPTSGSSQPPIPLAAWENPVPRALTGIFTHVHLPTP